MRSSTFYLVAGLLVSAVNAHFQLAYPGPRGPFVEDPERGFCDGYVGVTSNRTTFPLNNGVIRFTSEHPQWTFGVALSTAANASKFSDFNLPSNQSQPQLVQSFFQQSGAGEVCFNLNLAAANIAGVQDGANVTLEFIFEGGDGQLYQCADVVLSANASAPASASNGCQVNATSAALKANPSSASGSTPVTSSSSAAPSATRSGSASLSASFSASWLAFAGVGAIAAAL